MLLNVVALWKQEARDPSRAAAERQSPPSATHWRLHRCSGPCTPASWWRRPGPPRSACRTSCSSPMAARSSTSGSATTTLLTAVMAGGTLLAFTIGALAGARRRPVCAGGRWRGGRRVRVRRGDLRSAPLESPTCSARRRRAHRLRRRAVRRRHLTAAMALGREGTSMSDWRSAPGARCRRARPAARSRLAARCATWIVTLGARGALGDAGRPGRWLQLRLPPRDRLAVR